MKRLAERLALHPKTSTADGSGGYATTWDTTLATVSAALVPLTVREQMVAAAAGATQRYAFVIRYRPDVVATMRATWRPYRGTARTLEVHGVQPYEGGRDYLRIECAEVA